MNIIGHISTDFPTKFGIPRQSGLIEELKGVITFEPEYRQPEAFRGLEDFSHIWVLWQFSKSQKKTIVNGNSSKTWRESTNGSVCNKVAVQTE